MPDEKVPRRRVCWGPWENGDWLGHAAKARAASTITLRVDSLVTDEATPRGWWLQGVHKEATVDDNKRK